MDKLGVALLGLDHWYTAFAIAPQIAKSERVQLVSLSHDDEAKGQKAAQDYGVPFVTTDYRAALDRPDVDIVVALYSTDRNVAICQEAAGLGKHIVSVKPMALDLAGADAIVQAVRDAGVHFFPFESQRRLRPEDQRVKSWLDEGRIGRPLRYTQVLNGSLPQAWPGSNESGWWIDPAKVPGGAWLDHSIYAIDIARWLFGSEMEAVSGVVANTRYPDLAVEDYGIATYTLANGGVAVIEDTWTADRGAGFSRSEIIGTGGAIIDDSSAWKRISVKGSFDYEGWLAVEPLRTEETNAVEHIAMCISGEATPVATVDDGRANLAACLAFYEAARRTKKA